MTTSLLLDPAAWDLTLDASGNIATQADGGYRCAQDAACAMKLFLGEQWLDISQGVPYAQYLGGPSSVLGGLKFELEKAARTVTGVTDATANIQLARDSRAVTGTVTLLTVFGTTQVVLP